ncbi:chemotaxis protein CheD [Oceanobacillus kimchii]|uniref:chemotaxis protein CheD n=1 Tax=Oceanobacillus kimchii TaxID=746691 RepID=UPI00034D5CDE|nr:chemotaxis protein CheD [Oceanobacillus kimchii]
MTSVKTTVVKVGIADLKIIQFPQLIRTSGLGSCVGTVIYDEIKEIAGLSHVLLPNSQQGKQTNTNPYKYADTAIPYLYQELIKRGAEESSLKAKLAGGAQMFQLRTGTDMMRIGPRNVESVEQALTELGVPIVSKDVGGNVGRTIEFDPRSKLLAVRKINQESMMI